MKQDYATAVTLSLVRSTRSLGVIESVTYIVRALVHCTPSSVFGVLQKHSVNDLN